MTEKSMLTPDEQAPVRVELPRPIVRDENGQPTTWAKFVRHINEAIEREDRHE